MNIVDPILHQCKWQPSALAICAPGTIFNSVTYSQLERIIHNVSRNASERGLTQGKVVALFIKDPILHIAFILGLTRLGVATVSAREMFLPKELHIDAMLVDASYPPDPTKRAVVVDKQWALGDGTPPKVQMDGRTTDDKQCRIVLTSGTTGNAKAVTRTNRHIFSRTSMLQTVYGNRLPACSRIFVDMGLSTGMGFSFMVYTLSRGGSLFLRGEKVVDTLQALSAFQVQAIIASPSSLSELAEIYEEMPALFPGSFEVVVSTGSMITRALSERVRSRLGSNLVCGYGSIEALTVAAAPAHAIAKIDGAVGYVVPGVTLDIVDQSGRKLPPGKEGSVRIRSEWLVDGYIGNPPDGRNNFREDGFYPGDIGMMTPSGVLVISGREQAVINLGGEKVNPERIEAALTAYAQIRDAAAFPIASPLGIPQLNSAIVWRGEPDIMGLRSHLLKRLPTGLIPRSFLTVDAIPRNSSGKIERDKLKDLSAKLANGDGDKIAV